MDVSAAKRKVDVPGDTVKRLRMDDANISSSGLPSSDGYESSTDTDVRGSSSQGRPRHAGMGGTQGRGDFLAPGSQDDAKKKKLPRVSSSSGTRDSDKGNKGLRQFSMRVCQKVEEKGCTTYNEVADELVNECAADPTSMIGEEKNIRRRVYDALNVLMALNIIFKEKKDIRWNGLPTTSTQEAALFETSKYDATQRIRQKYIHFQELLLQRIVFNNLVKRNATLPDKPDPKSCIALPFILVNTHKEARINCEMTPASTQFRFEFDVPFEINDDIEVLTRMGFNKCTVAELKAMVSSDMLKYLPPAVLEAVNEGDANTVITFTPNWAESTSYSAESPVKV